MKILDASSSETMFHLESKSGENMKSKSVCKEETEKKAQPRKAVGKHCEAQHVQATREDEAAGKGSTISQHFTQRLAGMFAWTQQGYRNLMVRIQNFIIQMKMLHKELMEEEAT